MKLYRFSPLQDPDDCQKALEHIESGLRKLSEHVGNEQFPINTLKIFAHYPDEYKFLRYWVTNLGTPEDEESSTSYYVKPTLDVTVNDSPIEFVGIRTPDPYRSHVGCGDYVVENFDELKDKYLGESPFIREVKHNKYEMLELFHPDIDVLGYIVREYE